MFIAYLTVSNGKVKKEKVEYLYSYIFKKSLF